MSNANDPGYPGSLGTWCSSLSTSVFAVVETMSSYLGRLSLRSLPRIDLLHRWENGPEGFEPAGLSLRSGFRLQAPASLTPAKRLNFDRELCYRCATGPFRLVTARAA